MNKFKFLTIILCCVLLFCTKQTKVFFINRSILKNSSKNVFDLKSYNNTITKEYITNSFLKENNIEKGFKFTEIIEYGDNYKFGVSTKRSNLRFLPIDSPIYKNNDTDFDYLQNSEIKFNEPLLILFEYNGWYFVQTYNAIGWVKSADIAIFKTKKSFINYITNRKFLIVTNKNINVDNIYADMGVKINYTKKYKEFFVITIPERNKNGYVNFKNKIISKDGLNVGYLVYNRKNVIKQAYKYLGIGYGWGGSNNSVDCSGFISNVYSSFGIKLPRDSINQQKSTGNYIDISPNKTRGERLDILKKKAKIGSLLYFKGHIMLYLGFLNDKPYIIHSVALFNNEKVMSIITSDLDIRRNNGTTFIDSLSSITNL